jgi:hypothetical protein
MGENPTSGGDPEMLGSCRECGSVYPVQGSVDGDLRPIGTGGSCDCGNADFELLSDG